MLRRRLRFMHTVRQRLGVYILREVQMFWSKRTVATSSGQVTTDGETMVRVR